jgi:hypothetical protein
MQAYPQPMTVIPASFAETMELRRAWLGEAEYARQQALLRTPQGRAEPAERRQGDRRRTDRRAG